MSGFRKALTLFNKFGEPAVAATSIAFEMGISPGNLYYHYHSKEQIVADLFTEFRREIEGTLAAPEKRLPHAEDGFISTSCSKRSGNTGSSIGTSTIWSRDIT